MSEILFAVALLMLNVVVIMLAMTVKRPAKEIGEIKEKLEFHRIKLQYLESCELDNEKRIDQLENMLGFKEWLDEEKGE